MYFINFPFGIITGVDESPAGEGAEKPLLCALVPGFCLLRLYMSWQHREPRREMGKYGSDSLNRGDLGRCCLNWLHTSWTQYIMDLGWGWCFNGLISLERILLLCVFDYVKYCVKLLYQDELRLPFCIQYSLGCLSRILPVSCWNPLK